MPADPIDTWSPEATEAARNLYGEKPGPVEKAHALAQRASARSLERKATEQAKREANRRRFPQTARLMDGLAAAGIEAKVVHAAEGEHVAGSPLEIGSVVIWEHGVAKDAGEGWWQK